MKLFRIIPAALLLLAAAPLFTGCADDVKTTWEEYADWRNANEKWISQQLERTDEQGRPLFTTYTPSYAPSSTVHYRFIGEQNIENLQPYYTSTATVNYSVYLYDGTLIESGANFTSALNSVNLIAGWPIVIQQMHVGDSIEAILPYNVAYGSTGRDGINPYSALRFNIRLVDLPAYETRP